MKKLSLYKIPIVIISPLLAILLGFCIYIPVIKLIYHYESNIYFYATNGAASKNIFTSKEVEDKTNFVQSINDALHDKYTIIEIEDFDSSQITAYKIILKNKAKVQEKLDKNEEFKSYLTSNNVNLDDFFSFIDKMINFDQTILYCCFIIAWILVTYLIVVRLGLRKLYYFISFIGTIVFILSSVSNGFSDYLFFNTIYRHTGSTLNEYLSSLLPLAFAFIQSTTAFIIVDFLFQNKNNQKQILNNYLIDLNNMIDLLEIWIIKKDKGNLSKRNIKCKKDKIAKKFIDSSCEPLNYICKIKNRKKLFNRRNFNSIENMLTNDIYSYINNFPNSDTSNLEDYIIYLRKLRIEINKILKKY